MNALEQEIRERILTEGPMSLSDYMMTCLAHQDHGYYTTRLPVGGRASVHQAGGDFITAPEISQIFGELIGVWCMEIWYRLDKPKRFNLVELGPGRGTLMKDLLRAGKAMPGFLDAAKVFLVEISPTLAEQQYTTLSGQTAPISWVQEFSAIPPAPTIVVSNELLDAISFRQWVKGEQSWLERGVGLANGHLSFVTRPSVLSADFLPIDHEEQPAGTIFETSPARESIVAKVADHLCRNTGAALFIDYGHLEPGYGDTFQAMKDHAFCDVFENPGAADLTSHVDFLSLERSALLAGCDHAATTTQGQFLQAMGMLERAGILGRGQSAKVQQDLQTAVNRLALPDQMGNLFKVLTFGSHDEIDDSWPGFG